VGATQDARREWLITHGATPDELDTLSVTLSSAQLTADPHTTKPLYNWQLYSLMGKDRIWEVVGCFYERVFQDEEQVP